jgi:tetratricopeptide (TPR) repeat protein
MSDNSRIDELRRRVEKDPTSIAFAQLAEEYRRSGDFQQAVKVCRDGLARHPGYLSAQVTLGRALMELGEYDEAGRELAAVLHVAPDNLAAIRALAEIHQRRGDVPETIDALAKAKVEAPNPQPAETAEPVKEPEAVKDAQPAPEPEPVAEPEPLLDLDMPPLEEARPVDFSLDVSMPTFEEVQAPEPVPPPDISFELPAQTPPPGEDDIPSLEALDALTLDLPPMPDFSNWTLDTDLALDLPEPTFAEPALDQIEATPPAGSERTRPDDPALEELEQWLAAIVADRSPAR